MSQHIEMKIPHPHRQGLVVLIAGLVFMLVGKFTASPTFPWLTSGAFLLLFVVFNNGLGIFADNFGQYVQQSMPVFVGLLVGLGGLAYLISGISIYEAKSFRTIYVVLIMAYFTLLTLCLLVRQAADYLKDKG
jgi:hypothetical protein